MPEDVRKIEKRIEKKEKKEKEWCRKSAEKDRKKREKIITFLKENKGKSFKTSEIRSEAFGFFDFLDGDIDMMIHDLANDKNSPVHSIYKESYFLFLFDNSNTYYYYKD